MAERKWCERWLIGGWLGWHRGLKNATDRTMECDKTFSLSPCKDKLGWNFAAIFFFSAGNFFPLTHCCIKQPQCSRDTGIASLESGCLIKTEDINGTFKLKHLPYLDFVNMMLLIIDAQKMFSLASEIFV